MCFSFTYPNVQRFDISQQLKEKKRGKFFKKLMRSPVDCQLLNRLTRIFYSLGGKQHTLIRIKNHFENN